MRSFRPSPSEPLIRWRDLGYLITAFLAAMAIIVWQADLALAAVGADQTVSVSPYPYVTETFAVGDGDTYGLVMERAGVDPATSSAIFAAAEEVYDLSRVRLGRGLRLTYDRDSGRLERLTYQIDSEEILRVSRNEGGAWLADRRPIPYRVEVREASGEIESSLYLAGLEQGLDERAIIALADVFQWTIDFVMDVREGDRFRFVYEDRFLKGEYVMPGEVIAAKYVNDGEPHYAFRFVDSSGETGYFDESAESVQRQFLKAPAAFKYISSGFTTGLRYVSAFNTYTGHRAIDYAAPTGTPVRTVGDGTVVFAGWAGPYGYKVSVRHNSTYTTNYCHLSKILVSYGQKVSQGQTVGLVGNTGFSTGPHLHYEMVKWGTKINPLKEEFPPVEPVPEADRERYFQEIAPLKDRLDS